MTLSNRWIAVVALLLLPLSAAAQPATASDEDEQKKRALPFYEEATQVEAEARASSAGLIDASSAKRCTVLAIRSLAAWPDSKLALWRIVSCAVEADLPLVAWAAVNEFNERHDPESIATYLHKKISDQERERVTLQANQLSHQVQGVRLVAADPQSRLLWPAEKPPTVTKDGSWEPLIEAKLIQKGSNFYGRVGSRHIVIVGYWSNMTRSPVEFTIPPHFEQLRLGAHADPAPVAAVVMPKSDPVVAAVVTPKSDPVVSIPTTTEMPQAVEPDAPYTASTNLDFDVDVLHRSRRFKAVGTLMLLVGAAVGLVGGLQWVHASDTKAHLADRCPTRRGCDSALRSDYDSGRLSNTLGNVLVPTGATIAVLGGLIVYRGVRLNASAAHHVGMLTVGGDL